MAESQGVIVRRILSGQGTASDVRTAQANYQAWLRDQWNGDDAIALAYCVNALAEACGPDWETMPERDTTAHLWFFTFLCPRSLDPATGDVDIDALEAEAREYRDAMRRSPGGFREFAKRIRLVRGEQE